MSKEISRKRSKGAAGLKVLVTTASVAATIAGWAMLPSNDPPLGAVTSDQPSSQPSLSTPSANGNGSLDVFPGSSPQDQSLPQVQAPQSSFGQPAPFTSTHSSR